MKLEHSYNVDGDINHYYLFRFGDPYKNAHKYSHSGLESVTKPVPDPLAMATTPVPSRALGPPSTPPLAPSCPLASARPQNTARRGCRTRGSPPGVSSLCLKLTFAEKLPEFLPATLSMATSHCTPPFSPCVSVDCGLTRQQIALSVGRDHVFLSNESLAPSTVPGT